LVAVGGDAVLQRDVEQICWIPPGHGWIEGDNSSISVDSNIYGPIPLGSTQGRVVAVVWPPRLLRPIDTKHRLIYSSDPQVQQKLDENLVGLDQRKPNKGQSENNQTNEVDRE